MKRVFSGIQPSGRLHIGNYLGAIKNWISLQDKYDTIFGIVDYHAMTVKYNPEEMNNRVLNAAINYLAAGIDPEKSILMLQSGVKEHTELAWILNTITPISWLERVPTFKDKIKQNPDNINMALMDYPVLMAADILLYKAEFVPVGEDQVPHIELTREIARRFNSIFGNVFPEPKEIIGKAKRILGLDGREKMSKSLNNCIYLDETAEETEEKILKKAVTDPQRKRKSDAGNPEVCNVFAWHTFFSTKDEIEYVNNGCRKALIGCVVCKKMLIKNINKELEPLHEKQAYYQSHIDEVKEILYEGTKKAGAIAKETMQQVREAIGFLY